MIQNYTIGKRPITFTAKETDLIEVNEKVKTLVFIALLIVDTADVVETSDQNNFNIVNSYSTAVKIEVPYENVLITDPTTFPAVQIGLLEFIERELKGGRPFTLDFDCNLLKESSTKIVCDETTAEVVTQA